MQRILIYRHPSCAGYRNTGMLDIKIDSQYTEKRPEYADYTALGRVGIVL